MRVPRKASEGPIPRPLPGLVRQDRQLAAVRLPWENVSPIDSCKSNPGCRIGREKRSKLIRFLSSQDSQEGEKK